MNAFENYFLLKGDIGQCLKRLMLVSVQYRLIYSTSGAYSSSKYGTRKGAIIS